MQLTGKEHFTLFMLVVDEIRTHKADLRARKKARIKKDDVYEKFMERIGMSREEVKVLIRQLKRIKNLFLWNVFLSWLSKETIIDVTFTDDQKKSLAGLLMGRIDDIDVQKAIPGDLRKLAFPRSGKYLEADTLHSIAQKFKSSA